MRFKSQQHKSTFKKAIRKKDKTDTRLMAAMYLLTADQKLISEKMYNVIITAINIRRLGLEKAEAIEYAI